MKTFRIVIAVIAIAGGILHLPRTAIAGPLPADVNALIGFKGSTPFPGGIGPLTIVGLVEYAVYAPGAFGLSFGPVSDPSAGTEYVYAYQLFNAGLPTDSTVGALSVGLTGNPTVANIEALPDGFGNFGLNPFPTNIRFTPAAPPHTSAVWSYSPQNGFPELTSGQASEILLFTSPHAPRFYDASVGGGALISYVPNGLPSPIPEPAAGLLLGALTTALAMRLGNRHPR